MYLSAQHVRDSEAADGINVFVYTHRDSSSREFDWTSPDVGYVADRWPGKLVTAVRSVTAKRAPVLSFLDVAAADDISGGAVATLLEAAVAHFPGREWPCAWHSGPLGLRFYATRTLRHRAPDELTSLKDALLAVVGGTAPTPGPLPPHGPITIQRHGTRVGYRFQLSEESAEHLNQAGLTRMPRSVSVSSQNQDAFEIFTGRSIHDEVVQVLTGLDTDQIDALGGASIVDARTGKTVWRSDGAL